jgi:hypothetical protein
MLQKGAVEKTTLELLGRLTQEPILFSARLVGGTSLALQIGHRKSTDLDFFTNDSPDIQSIVKVLYEKYNYKAQLIGDKATIGFIDGVKIDVIYHPCKWLGEPLIDGGFRLATLKDIAAIKLHAITNSGQRPKDFVDIAFLSQFFSYEKIKDLAIEKYPMYDPLMFDRAIIYFDDINREAINNIKMINTQMDWRRIEQRIVRMTGNPNEIFKNPPLLPSIKKTQE